MNEINFVDRVKKHFSYLESDYDFRINHESNSNVRPQTDGVIEYTSNAIVVVIDSELGSAALWFYRSKDGRSYDLDPVVINEYLNTTDKEKALLLSTDPKDYAAASALSNQKFLLNQPGWKEGTDSTEAKLEIRLTNYATWLRTHASLCLEGDFSLWPKFYEYKIYRARADHLQRRKDEFGYVRAKDADGSWKLIKQSIFKEKLDHAEKLKWEFQGR